MANPIVLPDPCEFRQWIETVLPLLETSAYRWSVKADVPANLVSKILNGEQNDMRLSAACRLVRAAERLADEKQIRLPPLCPQPALSTTAAKGT